jgi:hypothetical protein
MKQEVRIMEKNNDKKSNGKYKFLLFLMFTKIGFLCYMI